MNAQTVNLKSEKNTRDLAVVLAGVLRVGDVVCLHGDLGAGKTAFARALIRHLCGQDEMEVPSPTFTLVQTYGAKSSEIWHYDLYRIKDTEEIYELGWEEAVAEALVLVEWPDRLGYLMPEERLDIDIRIDSSNENGRIVTLTPHGDWEERIKGFVFDTE